MPGGLLCAHVIGGGSADALKLTREAQSRVVLLTDGWGDAAIYAAMPHAPLVVGRKVVDPELRPDYLAEHGFDPLVVEALYFDANLREHVLANPAVQAWHGPCEVVCKTPAAMRWFAAFEAARTVRLAGMGKRAVVGNFSTGQPEPELWPDFQEALDAIRRYQGYLGLHEYSEPSRSWDTWYGGRFTRAPRDVPKIITEFGTDSLPPVPEDGSLPRRHPPGQPWVQQFGGNARAYAAWIVRMLLEYGKHADIVGVCLFTLGRLWPDHNVEGAGVIDEVLTMSQTIPLPVELGLVYDWSMYQFTDTQIGGKYEVRRWRDDFDWEALRQSYLRGEFVAVVVRCGIGETKDPAFERMVAGLDRLGIPWMTYHVYVESLPNDRQIAKVQEWLEGKAWRRLWGDVEDGSGEATFTKFNGYLLALDAALRFITGLYSGGPYMNRRFTADQQKTWRFRPTWKAGYPNYIQWAGWVGFAPAYDLHQFTDRYVQHGLPRPADASRIHLTRSLEYFFRPTVNQETAIMFYIRASNVPPELQGPAEAIVQKVFADVETGQLGTYYRPGEEPTPPPLAKHTMADRTNQFVINLFNRLFGGLATLEGVLTPAQKAILYAQRQASYSGPAVEDMALTSQQKAMVIAELELQPV